MNLWVEIAFQQNTSFTAEIWSKHVQWNVLNPSPQTWWDIQNHTICPWHISVWCVYVISQLWRHKFPIDVKAKLPETIPGISLLCVDCLWITRGCSLAVPFPSWLSSVLIGREGGGTSSQFMFTSRSWRKEWQCTGIHPWWQINKEVHYYQSHVTEISWHKGTLCTCWSAW